MLRFCFILFVVMISRLCLSQELFFDTYPASKEIVAAVYEDMDELQKLPDQKGKIIFSIVAPEVAMYSTFIDELETVSAEVFYTSFGKEYGNFSVGQFQMKPSFAEDIERAYKQECEACEHLETLEYDEADESEIRNARLDRLKMDSWQQVYLLSFYEIMEARHGDKVMTTYERTRFYASAYNLGFNRSDADIEDWLTHISFPGNMNESLVSYGDLAGDFLYVLRPDLCDETMAEAQMSAQFKGEGLAGAEYEVFSGAPVNFDKQNNRFYILPYVMTICGVLFLAAVVWLTRRMASKRKRRYMASRMTPTI